EAVSPGSADAACVVGPGRRPIRSSRPVVGVYASTVSLAAPLGSEPPAMTSMPPAAVTAAYRTGEGRCATTRAAAPGFQATIVSSHRVPVYLPTTYAVSPIFAAAWSELGAGR